MSSQKKSSRLEGKDLITIGIYTVIYVVIVMLVAMLGFIPIFIPLMAVLCPLIGGIPYMLYVTKAKKFGMTAIMGFLIGLIMVFFGNGYLTMVTGLVGGLLADVILKKAADRLLAAPSPAYEAFCEAQSFWLEDYALFMAVKAEQGQAGLADWPDDLRCRKPEAIAAAKQRLAGAVDYYKAVQFFFYTQWNALKAYANGKGVRLVGDIPIYVSPDSSDLWTHPELFQTDGRMHLTQVAGCPPDAFAADGQLWGNPLYDWPTHKATGFAWWKQRMKHATSIYDVVRIDHFRGFESYYSIPAGNRTAAGGHWEKGPDRDFIHAMHEALGEGSIIAEDLGYLTPEVKAMLAESGYPGMKIMQFAFDSRESGNYLPHTYPRSSVVYTGTHDNVTTEGWRTNASAEDVAYACRYLRCQPEDLTEAMICACLASVSDTAVIPLADWLHLGAEARINTPSTQGANWQWRLGEPLPASLASHIAELTALYERAPQH